METLQSGLFHGKKPFLAQVFHLSGSLDAKEISPDCIGESEKQNLLSCPKADLCLQSTKFQIAVFLIL